MDRLEAMTIFVTVAETGSFTAAGRRLGVPLPTVSRKVADLEKHLACNLLTRSTRRLGLSEAGKDYLASCKRILDEVGAAERKAAGEYLSPRGELVIAAPVGFGRLYVGPVVSAFLATYPEIDIRLLLSDRNAHLLDDHIDLAVRIGSLPDTTLIATQVGSVRRIVCGSPSYFAAHGVPQQPAELSSHACITFDALGSSTNWAFDARGRGGTSIPVRSRLFVNTAEAALDAATAGLGVTRVLSYQAARPIAAGELRLVLEPYEPAPIPVSILYPRQGLVPRKTRSFIDFAVPRLKASLKGMVPRSRGSTPRRPRSSVIPEYP